MPTDPNAPNEAPGPSSQASTPGPRPLSRRASRLLVIAAIVLVFALSFAAVRYLIHVAEQRPPQPPPADTTQVVGNE